MKSAGTSTARRGRIALLSLLALGAIAGSGASAAEAANPSVLNTGTGCSGQTQWLISCATEGQTDNSGNILRVGGWTSHDVDKSLASLLTDDDWDGTVDATTVRGLTTLDRPNINGGYPRSRFFLSYTLPTSNTGMECLAGFPPSTTRRNTNRNARIAPRDSANQTGSTTSSQIRYVAGSQCTGFEDYAYLYSWGANNFVNTTTLNPGESKTFTYTGDDKDTTGDSDFNGVNWRTRNLRTGALSAETLDCDNNGDNAQKSTTVTFPDRGAFVVEAKLRDGGSCGANQNGGYWFPLGTADVNSTAAPTLTLDSATTTVGGVVRPNSGSDWTVRAQGLVDPDSADGGGAQIVEWDVDSNNANGVSGFEASDVAGYGATLPAGTSQNVDSSGQAPGLYSVRGKVTDNGAGDAADSIRRTSSAVTLQYRVNAIPVLTAPTTATTSVGTAVGINLSATDADSDTRTYTVQSGPSHGTGSFTSATGASTTYNYTPTGSYAGTDSITFKVDDGFGGTDTKTVAINVEPDTTIGSTPADTDANPSFSFSSNGSPVTFECQMDGGGFTACASPKSYPGLAQGAHTFQVRAKATTGGTVDPSPASYSWTLDSIAPDTQFDQTPTNPSTSTSAQFKFSSPDGTATFQCRLDSSNPGDWAACTSPQNLSGLSQGAHTYEVRAKDPAGNIDATPVSFTWTIDSIAPTTTLNTYPDDPTNVSSASFSFTADETALFACELDGAGFTPCTSPQTYPGPLSDGSHTFKVRATDAAGNTGNTVTKTWVVDTAAPDTLIDPPTPANPTNQSMADFNFHSTETGSSFQCRLDSSSPGAWGSCTSPKHLTGLTHGSHTFEVRATDAAGNTDASPATYTWTVDLIAPATSIDDGSVQYPPPGIGNAHHRTTSADADFDFFSNDGAATFECRLDSSLEADFQPCNTPQQFTGLSDGPHKFEVRAKDLAGNVDATPATWLWEVYTGLPDTILDVYPDNPDNSDDPHFEFHGSIPDSTFTCSLDGAPAAPCVSPVNYTDLDDGEHTLVIVATDEFSRVDPTPTTYTWTIDTAAPDTNITASPDDPTNVDTALFQFEAPGDPTATFECKLDATDWEACGETQPQEYTSLGEGSHTFQVRATDAAGNTDQSPDSYTWFVDLTAPDASIDAKPDDPSNINNPSFQFSATDNHSANADMTFECRLDSSSPSDWESCETDLQYNDLTEGSHTFEVRATDEAGNTGDPESYTWYVDLTAPDTTITDGPDDPTNETSSDFTFSGTDNHSASGDLGFECRLDSSDEGDWAPCSSPQNVSSLTDGEHTLEVRAIDEAGNKDTSPASYTWTVDLGAPDTTIDSGPDDPTNDTSATLEFSSEPDATFECRLDSTVEADFADCDSPVDYNSLGEGPHVFEVRATDTAGNTGPVATHTWNVDTTAPDTTIDAPTPTDPSNDTAPSFDFSGTDNFSDPGDLTFECDLDGGGYASCDSPEALSGLGEGSHTFSVRATDEAGNTDQSPDSYTWTVDTTGPTMTFDNQPTDPTSSTGAEFHMFSEAGATFECRIDSDQESDWQDCGPFAAIYNSLTEGSHTWEARATDTAGNTGPVESYTWFVDLTKPDTSIDDPKPPDPDNDPSPSLQFSGTDNHSAAGDLTFECDLDGAGYGQCTSPEALSGLTEGSHTYSVRATDEAGNTDQSPASYTWFVDLTAPETSITAQPNDPSNVNTPTFQFNGTDNHSAAGDLSFECDVDGGGYGSCDSPETLNSLGDGSHTFSVRATDEAGNPDQTPDSYTWVVDTTPPVINITDGPDDPTNQADASFQYTVEDATGDVKCGVDTPVPTDVCTSPANFTGLSDGQHTFYVTAGDAAGNTATSSYSWTIDTVAPDTLIQTGPSAVTSSGEASFGFGSNEEAVTFECQLDGNGFHPCDGSFLVHGLGVGDHRLDVRATDAAGNTDPTPATRTWTVEKQGVLGAGPPIIKKRVRSLNVPMEGSFQVATVTCRAGNCTITKKSAKIKIGSKVYNGGITIEVVAKEATALVKGEVAQVIVHFAPEVQRSLAAEHLGQLVVKLEAQTDAGGASAFKKIKLKAKYLKALLG